MPLYIYECVECGKTFEEVQTMNAIHTANHCDKVAKRVFTVPQVDKDMMYQFTTSAFGKPVDIYSRRQYKKLLKKHGCADATIADCLSVKPKNDIKDTARKVAKELKEEIYEKGAMDYVLGKENPNGSDNINEVRL